MTPRKRRGRKLLVASIGVAAVSYVACDTGSESVANLVAPPDTGSDQQGDQQSDQGNLDVVANLVAPPDASED